MLARDQVDERVLELVAKFCHKNKSKISLDTEINTTLGVDGADGDDLIDLISHELGWPVRNFDLNDYFGPEVGWNPFTFLFLPKHLRKKLMPLTVRTLSAKCFES